MPPPLGELWTLEEAIGITKYLLPQALLQALHAYAFL